MMKRIPFADSVAEQEENTDEFKPAQPPVPRPKAAFQWPPDCVWPFLDHGCDSNT